MSHDVDLLLQRYEMGQAYIAITKKMGPSLQLLAFVNHTQEDQSNFGLESMDPMAEHAIILKSIENDTAFEMAMEGLADHLKEVGDGLAEVGRKVQWNTDSGSSGNILGSVMRTVGNRLSSHSDSLQPHCYPYHDFSYAVQEFNKALMMEMSVARAVPKTFELKAWKRYQSLCGEQMRQFNKGKVSSWSSKASTTPHYYHMDDKVPFRDTDWDQSKYTNAKAWLKDNYKRVADLAAAYKEDVKRIEQWLIHGGQNGSIKESAEGRKVMAIINATIGIEMKFFGLCIHFLHHAQAAVDSVPIEKKP
jgi:hypothetical protein